MKHWSQIALIVLLWVAFAERLSGQGPGCGLQAVAFHLRQPDCLDPLGEVFIDSVRGGVPPYAFALDGGPLVQAFQFGELAPGAHLLRVEDAAGCVYDTAFVLEEVVQPVLSLIGPLRVELGDSVVLTPLVQPSDLAFAKIRWQPDRWLSCADCLTPVLKPQAEGQFYYHLFLETEQYCTAEANVLVRVFFNAPIYVPNVFSPNGDGENDVLVPMARSDKVLRIVEFAIYNRWGELMHLARDFAPGDEKGGWDGLAGRQKAPPAVYFWRVRALLANGKEVTLRGDVLLIR